MLKKYVEYLIQTHMHTHLSSFAYSLINAEPAGFFASECHMDTCMLIFHAKVNKLKDNACLVQTLLQKKLPVLYCPPRIYVLTACKAEERKAGHFFQIIVIIIVVVFASVNKVWLVWRTLDFLQGYHKKIPLRKKAPMLHQAVLFSQKVVYFKLVRFYKGMYTHANYFLFTFPPLFVK